MNADGVLAALAQIGDDPAQVQQLRKVIVALAISGKLTVGDCAIDSPHAEDLDRSSTAVPATGRSSSRKRSVATINQEDLPESFVEPRRFVRLDSVATIEKGRTGIKGVMPGPYPMVVTAAERITSDHYDFDGAAAIVPLVSSTGHGKASLHRLHYQEGRFALGTILAAIFPHDPEQLSARFLYEYLTTFKEELLVSRMIGTANVSLSVAKIADVPIPLIHKTTQQRVDELMALCDQLEAARAQREATRGRLAAASLARLNAADPDTFHADARFALDALPALTTRPDQIKLLRQTILNLAVRGKLVPQDASDEPASSLLAMIAEARTAAGARDSLEPIDISDQRFEIPPGWRWARLGTVCSKTGSGSTPRGGKSAYKRSGIPFLRSQNIYNEGLRLNDVAYIDEETHHRMSSTAVHPMDLLLNITGGSTGRCCRVPYHFDKANISQHVAIIRAAIEGISEFLHCTVMSPYFQAYIVDEQTGAGRGGLPKNRMDRIAIALPPLAEQHRIVAKVEELMALCDQLEASLTSGKTTRLCLLDALLHEALAPAENLAA